MNEEVNLNETVEASTSEAPVEITRQEIPIGMFSKGPRVRLGNPEKVFLPRPLSKVVILGMGHSLFDWVHECYGVIPPFSEPGTEIWSLNYSGFAFHSHVCFNMHNLESGENLEHRKIFEQYAQIPHLKIVSVKSYDWLPNSYEYPLQEIMEDPYANVPYFTNSTAYLVALAIACRAKEIKLYGCDFDYDEKYLDVNKFERGRANLEFWLGRASAYGCLLTVAQHSTLLGVSQTRQNNKILFYGYDNCQPQFEMAENDGKLVGFDVPPPAAEEMLEPGKGEELNRG